MAGATVPALQGVVAKRSRTALEHSAASASPTQLLPTHLREPHSCTARHTGKDVFSWMIPSQSDPHRPRTARGGALRRGLGQRRVLRWGRCRTLVGHVEGGPRFLRLRAPRGWARGALNMLLIFVFVNAFFVSARDMMFQV